MKVVIDTNVFISAGLIPYGYPRRILDRILFGESIELYVSREILDEYQLVSQRTKFHQRRKNLGKLFRRIRKHAKLIVPAKRVEILKDPEDNKFLECVRESQADFLVTGNRIDFQIRQFEGTKVVNPTEFWEIISSQG